MRIQPIPGELLAVLKNGLLDYESSEKMAINVSFHPASPKSQCIRFGVVWEFYAFFVLEYRRQSWFLRNSGLYEDVGIKTYGKASSPRRFGVLAPVALAHIHQVLDSLHILLDRIDEVQQGRS